MIGALIWLGMVVVMGGGGYFVMRWWINRKFRLEEKRANDEFVIEVMALPRTPDAPPEVNEAFDRLRQAMIDDLRSYEK